MGQGSSNTMEDLSALGSTNAPAAYMQIQGRRQAADAAGRAAEAQLAEERATRKQALELAGPSPMEIQQLERAVQLNEQDVTRRQKLLDSADPALIEAGKQALSLLQGQEAKTLDPIKRQRAQQRQVLQDTLAQRLGPGWETSSAGIQALTKFDEATDNVLAQTQQQTMAQLLGVSQDTAARYGLDASAKTAAGLSAMRGNINNRQVAALLGSPINNAGAPFVRDMMEAGNLVQAGQNFQKSTDQIIGMAGRVFGGMFGGPAGAMAGGTLADSLSQSNSSPTSYGNYETPHGKGQGYAT